MHSTATGLTGRRYAFGALVRQAFPGVSQIEGAIDLLCAPPIDAEAATLDSHLRLTKEYVDAVTNCLARLDRVAFLSLQVSAKGSPVHPANQRLRDGAVDAVALWLVRSLPGCPDDARRLAVAIGRLIEETSVLQPKARLRTPLGRGFEAQQHARLALRFELLPDRVGHLAVLEAHLALLLEEPDEGLARIERGIGRALSSWEREWLAAERFVGMLRTVRRRKTEAGQIRWYLRPDPAHGVVLDRYGTHGHWLVAGPADTRTLTRAGMAVARVAGENRVASDDGWRAVIVDDGTETSPPADVTWGSGVVALDETRMLPLADVQGARGAELRRMAREASSSPGDGEAEDRIASAARAGAPPRRRARVGSYALTADEAGVALANGESPGQPLARVQHDADDDALLDFLDVVARVREVTPVVDAVQKGRDDSEAVRWTRALLSNVKERPAPRPGAEPSTLRVRLVYVPSAQPHPLGGMPLIGLQFVRDRLERFGAEVDIVSIRADELEGRLVELLGADVIGISVYLTNREQASELVRRLRDAGFAGRIVLGGPELRDIELIQDTVEGWDALIRGEGEEALPDVLRVFGHLDAGEIHEGLQLARTLRGVVIAHGDLVVVADSAARNVATDITCPLPFDWSRSARGRNLQMNFTRGCPYACGFCPNHQGQRIHASDPDEMWRFTACAVADRVRLPRAEEVRCARSIQETLGVEAAPRLRLAWDLALRQPVPVRLLTRLRRDLEGLIDADLAAEAPRLKAAIGLDRPLDAELAALGPGVATPWEAKRTWLLAKATVLATAHRRAAGGPQQRGHGLTVDPFELMTSEDNTLVNREVVRGYLRQRRASGLTEIVTFNPGQNTVRDLTDRKGGVDGEYIAELTDANPFRIALGADGTSNPVLRQNHKPQYRVADLVAVNRALVRRGVRVENNYILLTPETDLLEAIEAMALFLLLPVTWRDYGDSINLRVIKEPGTLSHDEGMLFAPDDDGHHDPFRFGALDALVARWDLTPLVHSAELEPLLWRILEQDEDARELLPLVVRRWERDFDRDPILVSLAARIRAASGPDVPMATALRKVAEQYEAEWLDASDGEETPRAARDRAASSGGVGARARSRRPEPVRTT